MTSMFYQPALEILKANAKSDMGAGEIAKAIMAQYPDLKWSGYQGPVRAMLLKASELSTPIKRVPDSRPPRFYYDDKDSNGVAPQSTPEEEIESAFKRIDADLAHKLQEQVESLDETMFEELVNRVVGKALLGDHYTTPKTNDGGIDGYVFQDNLGVNVVCVQAKHYKSGNNVQRPEIDSFIGALEGRLGVFVTSSRFSDKAIEKAKHTGSSSRVILVDGKRLIELMIEYNVGTQDTEKHFVIKRIDEDFFRMLRGEE